MQRLWILLKQMAQYDVQLGTDCLTSHAFCETSA